MYARTRPIQSGCADTPISTKTMPNLSISERGLRAEMSPIGIAISSQTTAPPMTSDIVTGAARPITSTTGCRLRCETPKSPCTTCETKEPYSRTIEPPSIPTVSRSVVPWSTRKPRRIVSLLPGMTKKRTYV